MLSDIKTCLLASPASIGELALRFRVSPDAMRGMLDHWIRKGMVARDAVPQKCSCCTSCHEEDLEIYRWVGR